jgi:Na+-translocating ferredoxin:NAD+ oxidoreductase RnfC subunit
MKRLGITRYDVPSLFAEEDLRVGRVQIPLSQHIGSPARPLVKPGDRVVEGQCIGEVEEEKLGARVHASISGVVRAVDSSVTIERA